MNIETRHMLEKNKKACFIGTAILIFGLILCALGFALGNPVTPLLVIRVSAFFVLIAVYRILFRKQSDSIKFMRAGTYTLIVGYALILFFTYNLYMYAYMYLLIVYVMIYMDKKFTLHCAIGCGIFNVIAMIRFLVVVPNEMNTAIIQCVFAIFANIMAFQIVNLQDRQNRESMDQIEANARSQAAVSGNIIQLSEELASKFEVAKETADLMTESMDSSNNAVVEISESIKVTAESIEQQTGLTEDIQRNLEETENDTKKMQEAADASSVAVREGRKAMEMLSKQAMLTGELNRKSQVTTTELGNRIKDVEDITGEILNISSQTNLLALNASIEAARAGEAGKGFAVVADEIRQLSEQTKNSVNKITEIINRLVENSNEASENMLQSIEATDEQNRMVSSAIGNISEIEEKNGILLELMAQISTQIHGILSANTQINDSISNLSAMSEEVAASAESSKTVMDQSMRAVEELNGLLAEIYEISRQMEVVAQNNE